MPPIDDVFASIADAPAPAIAGPAITALATLEDAPRGALLFERLAADPNVPVEKLERLIAMQERILAHQAKAAFDTAFAEMQGEIPIITKRGEIVADGVVRSRFAKHEDIQRVVRPILKRYGFSMRHRNKRLDDGTLKITGILSHRSGHSEEDEFEGTADDSGKKNRIQSVGSTREYGRRYTTVALLNITTENEDDDGQASEQTDRPDSQAPSGFHVWWNMLQADAPLGFARLSATWNTATPQHRAHLLATNKAGWSALRAQATHVDASTTAHARAVAGQT